MPEVKVQLGVGEAEALAEWLEEIANLYDTDARISAQEAIDATTDRKRTDLKLAARNCRTNAAQARDWAKRVKPVPVGGWK